MTDRHAGYVVTLESPLREDDAQATLDAIRMIKGVLSVEPIVSSPEVMAGAARARDEFRQKLYDFVREVNK